MDLFILNVMIILFINSRFWSIIGKNNVRLGSGKGGQSEGETEIRVLEKPLLFLRNETSARPSPLPISIALQKSRVLCFY